VITLNLNGTEKDVTLREAEYLKDLTEQYGWEILSGLLFDLEQAQAAVLADVQTPLDDVRYFQGRLSVVGDVRKIVEDLIPTQLAEAMKNQQE
jgi:hypothetical protein